MTVPLLRPLAFYWPATWSARTALLNTDAKPGKIAALREKYLPVYNTTCEVNACRKLAHFSFHFY